MLGAPVVILTADPIFDVDAFPVDLESSLKMRAGGRNETLRLGKARIVQPRLQKKEWLSDTIELKVPAHPMVTAFGTAGREPRLEYGVADTSKERVVTKIRVGER